MTNKEDELRERLLATFRIEADEHIKAIARGLIGLEKLPSAEVQADIVETIFRRCHSMKGAARAVNLIDIETICHSLEGIFSAWKQEGVRYSRQLFDTIHNVLNIIETIIASPGEVRHQTGRVRISGVIKDIESSARIAGFTSQETVKEFSITASSVQSMPHTARHTDRVMIPAEKLNSILLQSEEMLTVKQASQRNIASISECSATIETLKKECAKFSPGSLTVLDKQFSILFRSAKQHDRIMGRMVDNLLGDMKKAVLLPFSTLLENFPVLVRNIAAEVGKEAEFVTEGDCIEIDRRILDEMRDPLIHMVRNSIDHGIESPNARTINRKTRRGTIKIAISQLRGDSIELIVSDDGAGIDIKRVKEEAVNAGALSHADRDRISDKEALNFIFHSGVSTSPVISDISGRGLGLAIMREKVERLGGAISIDSYPGRGTTFHIVLPLTIATFRGITVMASGRTFIVPTSSVERCVRILKDDIKTVENKETISLDGMPVSFIRLENILELPYRENGHDRKFIHIFILRIAGKQIAIGVDEIFAEQEVLAKGLGRQLYRVRNVSGAAVDEAGRPVPILHVADLLRSATKTVTSHPSAITSPQEKEETQKGNILVVEDSVTSRMLLKNILETAGYNVRTAVDGIDAMTALKNEGFDLVVSDIEMPHMNGLDLTAKIRADKRLADLPVVLVTALERREDRERGIEVGADAYIIKSSFDQSNLLEIVKRLI